MNFVFFATKRIIELKKGWILADWLKIKHFRSKRVCALFDAAKHAMQWVRPISHISDFEWGRTRIFQILNGRKDERTILAFWVETPILCHPLPLPIYHRPYHIKIGSGTFYFSFYLVNNWSFLLRTFLYFNRCAMKFETHCFERWYCAASAGSANQVCNLIWCQLFDTKLENIGAQRHLSELTQN